jgi:hypothetical protein
VVYLAEPYRSWPASNTLRVSSAKPPVSNWRG